MLQRWLPTQGRVISTPVDNKEFSHVANTRTNLEHGREALRGVSKERRAISHKDVTCYESTPRLYFPVINDTTEYHKNMNNWTVGDRKSVV